MSSFLDSRTYHLSDPVMAASVRPVVRSVEGVVKMCDQETSCKRRVVNFVRVWSEIASHLFWDDVTVVAFVEVCKPITI